MSVVPSPAIGIGERKGPPQNGLCQADQPKEGAHAFKDESYHIEWRGTSVDVELVGGLQAVEGPRLAMYRQRGVERRVAGGRPPDLGGGGLLRFGGRAFRSGGVQRVERWFAEDAEGARTAAERRTHGPPLARHAAAAVAGGHRLALGAVLWRAGHEQERVVLRRTAAGHLKVPCVCHGLHRRVRSALYAGVDLGPTSRNDRRGAAAVARSESAKSA